MTKDHLIDRRVFLKDLGVAGLGVAAVSLPGVKVWAALAEDSRISNSAFRAAFNVTDGTLSVWRSDGTPLLHRAVAAIQGAVHRSTGDSEYRHRVTTQGATLTVFSEDQRREIDFRWELTLGEQEIFLQLFAVNRSDRAIQITSLETARAVLEEGGMCFWPGTSKVLTNGYMYPDPGRLQDFEWSRRKVTESNWNMAFYRGAQSEGLVVGFAENRSLDGFISARMDETVARPGRTGGMALIARSMATLDTRLAPGQEISGGRLVFQLAPTPFDALERYADHMARFHDVKLKSPINGWCHWAYTKQFVDENEVLRNAEFAAKHLKAYGLEYIQIDDGYPVAYGDWEGSAERFPHGMKWIAGKIRELGFKPGIWMCPFAIAEGTEVHRDHPEWLIRDLNGEIQQCGGGPEHEKAFDSPMFHPKIYGLDITHPGAAEWLRQLFMRYANDFGYEMFKLDFVEWTILRAERYFDPSFSKASAYRRAMQIIRDAIGPDRHILDCGPSANAVGLIDSTRINLDYAVLNEEQYFDNFNSNAGSTARRYYFHNRVWINDDDHVGVAHLSPAGAQGAASIIALSGGNLICSDRLVDLEPSRLEILRKLYPQYGRAARPLDLFKSDRPGLFSLDVENDTMSWKVFGFANYEPDTRVDRKVSAASLGLDPKKNYLAYDFWGERSLGAFRDHFQVGVGPGTVQLISVREDTGRPQVLSTSRHFTQGAIELRKVRWEEAAAALSGTALGDSGMTYHIAIHIPEGYAWDVPHTQLTLDQGAYSIKLNSGLLQVSVRFRDGAREVPWAIRFRREA